MATKNKFKKDKVEIITQKTPERIMIELILSDEKEFLFSESAEKQLLEMHKIRQLFVDYGSRSRVIQELMSETHNYSYQTALKAVSATTQIFATIPQNLSRDFWVDIHLQKLEETWRTAKELGDAKTMALADRNRAEFIEKFLGTKELVDQSKLHLPDVEIGFHPELFNDVHELGEIGIEQIKNAFRKRKKLQQQREIIDIDHEEVR